MIAPGAVNDVDACTETARSARGCVTGVVSAVLLFAPFGSFS